MARRHAAIGFKDLPTFALNDRSCHSRKQSSSNSSFLGNMLMKATFPAVAASLRQDSGTSSPAMHENLERYRLLVVGDNGCGKTCLLKSFVKSDFEVDDTSSDIFEECMETVRIGTRRIEFMLCDLSGQEEYDGLRIELYHNADVFLVCFDIGNPNSLTNIDDTWIPEIKDEAPDIPFIVVGCKNDLRTDSNLSYYLAVPGTQSVPESSDSVNRIKAEKVAIDSGAKDYIECCARTGFNISHVFQSAANAVLCKSDLNNNNSNNSGINSNNNNMKEKSNFGLKNLSKYARRRSTEIGERFQIKKGNKLVVQERGSRRGSLF